MVGDLINLSVITPTYLKKKKLVPETAVYTPEMEMNQLYLTALKKIPLLPYSYVMDLWRWNVFKKLTKPKDYTKHWWELT